MNEAEEAAWRKGLTDKWRCELIMTGLEGRVVILDEKADGYHDMVPEKKGKISKILRWWCDGRPIHRESFNQNEGRSPGKIMLKAFKVKAYRLYGSERDIEGVNCFVIVDYDPAKKDDLAKPRILDRAKVRLDHFAKGKNHA